MRSVNTHTKNKRSKSPRRKCPHGKNTGARKAKTRAVNAREVKTSKPKTSEGNASEAKWNEMFSTQHFKSFYSNSDIGYYKKNESDFFLQICQMCLLVFWLFSKHAMLLFQLVVNKNNYVLYMMLDLMRNDTSTWK